MEQFETIYTPFRFRFLIQKTGRSGSAMVLGKLPVPGCPKIWMIVGQVPIAIAVGAGEGGGHFYSPLSFLSSFYLSLGDGPI